MIRVFIVDDHEIIRHGLKTILENEADVEVVGEEENGTELLRQLSDIECDVMLLDLNIPGRNGIELIEELKKRKPQMHILVISISPENKSALPSLNAGAAGYLSKDTALSEMIAAIRKVYSKGRYLSVTLAEQLAFDLLEAESFSKRKLSGLESNITLMLSKGNTVKVIASELGLSVSTVFSYRRKIFEKLKIKNNVELAHYVIENEVTA
ncbi:MAG TPA: response regulator transcription factor [Paludibacter sp.]|nr:response regulator transcription factor [Paludibacter sp.]